MNQWRQQMKESRWQMSKARSNMSILNSQWKMLQDNWTSLQFSEHEIQFWQIDHCQMAGKWSRNQNITNITDLQIQSLTATYPFLRFLYFTC